MASINFTIEHVPAAKSLPTTLDKGKLYFIDSEGTLAVDYGSGKMVYGRKIADQALAAIGTLSSLTTSDKTSAVNALNELVAGKMDKFGLENNGALWLCKHCFRGKKLGASPTVEQMTALRGGPSKFKNELFIGDYWDFDNKTLPNLLSEELQEELADVPLNSNGAIRFTIVDFAYLEYKYTILAQMTKNTLFQCNYWDEDAENYGFLGSSIYTKATPIGDKIVTELFANCNLRNTYYYMSPAAKGGTNSISETGYYQALSRTMKCLMPRMALLGYLPAHYKSVTVIPHRFDTSGMESNWHSSYWGGLHGAGRFAADVDHTTTDGKHVVGFWLSDCTANATHALAATTHSSVAAYYGSPYVRIVPSANGRILNGSNFSNPVYAGFAPRVYIQ